MKQALLLTLLCLSGLGAHAQEGFHIGAVTSYQATYLIDSDFSDASRVSYDGAAWHLSPIGASLGYHWSDETGIFLQGILGRTGYTFIMEGGAPGQKERIGELELDLQYFHLPLLFRVTSAPRRTVGVNFMIGPQVSFLLNGQEQERFDEGFEDRTLGPYQNRPGLVNRENRRTVASTDEADGGFDFERLNLGAVMVIGVRISLIENLYLTANARFVANLLETRTEAWLNDNQNRQNYGLTETEDLRTRRLVSIGPEFGVHYVFGTR